ncbi:NAD-dependent dehydratase [Jeotgalibacillus malaysiensis]|uniref:NAD-dependent dehydratase n=1 Tax=Jeotgalibacillus malaysiensis TaxID=1508404 RepID=A0A0B5ARJ3_9BACL|nr:UDP-glucuronic acid decarboxylase family protein [Jeotgalibacillus malaysiensis]AJD92696.1 NAD-dependent dehydratase [Jeotgalibacillus malaysiensis]
MKRILVAGGAGFIGVHLVKKLLEEGHKVICVDNLMTGSKDNIYAFLTNPNYSFIEHDVINPIDVTGRVDEIYNLACPASPPLYQKDPIHTMKTSVLGAINLLELAKKHDAKILQASTSEVYGDPLQHPQPEGYFGNVNPVGTRSCYDEGKRCAETLFIDYHRAHQVKVKIVRIFNTYGPYMDVNDGRVVSNFINQAIRNEDITIYGSGNQTRSFCYVEDLVRGFILMMNSSDTVIGPINLGNPVEYSIDDFAKKIIRMTGSRSERIYQPLPSDDPQLRKPNIDLAKAILNWEPEISVDEGISKTIEYFKALKDYQIRA